MDIILHHPDGDNLECGGTGVGCVFLWSSVGESGGGAGFRPSTDSGLCSWSEASCKIANAMFGGWACEVFRPLASVLPKPRAISECCHAGGWLEEIVHRGDPPCQTVVRGGARALGHRATFGPLADSVDSCSYSFPLRFRLDSECGLV